MDGTNFQGCFFMRQFGDIASMMGGAKKERSIEIAKNLLGMNLPIDQIVTATGLTREEVENLYAL